MVMIRGAYGGHLVRHVDGLVHHVEDVQPRVAGLLQRGTEHRGGDAVELGVELQRGDEVLVPATLKSMSPNASSAPRMSVSAT